MSKGEGALNGLVSTELRSAVREAELVAVWVEQLDSVVLGAAEPVRSQDDESVDFDCQIAVGQDEVEALPVPPALGRHRRAAPRDLGATVRGLDRSLLVLIHTRGQPSASAQKSPTCRVPSQASSPRKPQPAKNELPGSITQNSFPSGSASTMCRSSGSWPTSRWSAPSLSAAATVACCPAGQPGLASDTRIVATSSRLRAGRGR